MRIIDVDAHLHEPLGCTMESPLRPLELREVVIRHLGRGDLRREALELGSHHERLTDLVQGKHPHSHPTVRLERDEPQRGETS